MKPHDAIYLLAAERDALKAENVELVAANDTLGSDIGQIYAELLALRLALVKWKREMADHYAEHEHVSRSRVDMFMDAIVPSDLWGLGVTGGEPR